MQTPLPFETSFKQFNNPYNKEEFLKVCHEYGVDSNPMKYRGQYFFSSYQGGTLTYFTDDSMCRWIIENSKGFTKTGLFMISESVRAYVYLVLSSQASARSSIVGDDASAFTAQRVFMNNFEDVVNRRVDIQQDIKRYQDMLNYASSKVDYSVGQGIYMLPSNMDLNIKSGVARYNNKILISDTNLNLGINKKINAPFALETFDRAIQEHSSRASEKVSRASEAATSFQAAKGARDLAKGARDLAKRRKGHPKLNPTVGPGLRELVTSLKPSSTSVSSHEEEKIALILGITTAFSIWYMFKGSSLASI